MSSDDLTFLPLKVNRAGSGGKRTFDPDGKQRLIEACLRPGVSICGMALKAGINANQLRKWVRSRQQAHLPDVMDAAEPAPPAFMPVVQIASAPSQVQKQQASAHRPARLAPPVRLSARLPNGVTVELECTGQDATLVSAVIDSLGRYDVPTGR
jgi:transposase